MVSTVRVVVNIKKDILDPAGEALKKSLQRQGIETPLVRIGKVIDVTLNDRQEISEQINKIKTAASEILSNPIMEDAQLSFIDENDHEQ
ncbi:MAG: phosphoribosylformylglycinamidine synthase subunit PurS [Myxococcales bacterium]|nr:phosphoribosylformylglycinamidine synthase subunit PurS [Myxococcales bacterium]USN50977.1 MAG: phosphoribosylformylglycinamidine synthase subunit PurS [Myxococcales bacterium]